MNAGTEVGPLADTFDYNARKPHPDAFCPVCGAVKRISAEACCELCEDLMRWLKTQPEKHDDHAESPH